MYCLLKTENLTHMRKFSLDSLFLTSSLFPLPDPLPLTFLSHHSLSSLPHSHPIPSPDHPYPLLASLLSHRFSPSSSFSLSLALILSPYTSQPPIPLLTFPFSLLPFTLLISYSPLYHHLTPLIMFLFTFHLLSHFSSRLSPLLVSFSYIPLLALSCLSFHQELCRGKRGRGSVGKTQRVNRTAAIKLWCTIS